MDRTTAVAVSKGIKALLDTRFTYRSVNAIDPDFFGVLSKIEDMFQLEQLTRRADGKTIYAIDRGSRSEAAAIAKVLDALTHPKFTYRKVETVMHETGLPFYDVDAIFHRVGAKITDSGKMVSLPN